MFGGGVLEAERESTRAVPKCGSVAQARREAQCAAAVMVFLLLLQCDESTSRSTAHGTLTMAVPYSGDDVR